MKHKAQLLFIGVVMVALLSTVINPLGGAQAKPLQQANDPSLDAQVYQDANNRWVIILENSKIRVKWSHINNETPITDFILKTAGNQDQVTGSGVLDAAAHIKQATNASILYDGTDRKTVRIEWKAADNLPGKEKIQEVSIYPNGTYIKIDYIKYFVNIVDIGNPGGAASGTYHFYGANSWVRNYILYEESYYNRSESPYNDPANGGSLNYKNYFIGGIYNPSNGQGFGRVMPVPPTDIIKLLFNRGFEWFPYYLRTQSRFTGYLYGVTGGANEIISVGQALADGNPVSTSTPTRTRTPTKIGGFATSTPTRTNTPSATPTNPITGNNKFYLPLISR